MVEARQQSGEYAVGNVGSSRNAAEPVEALGLVAYCTPTAEPTSTSDPATGAATGVVDGTSTAAAGDGLETPPTAGGSVLIDPVASASGVTLPNTGVGTDDQTQSGFSYQLLAIAVVLIAAFAIGILSRRGDRPKSR